MNRREEQGVAANTCIVAHIEFVARYEGDRTGETIGMNYNLLYISAATAATR